MKSCNTNGEVQAGLPAEGYGLQRDSPIGASDQHVGCQPCSDGNLAASAHVVASEESRTVNCVCEDEPHHETAAREAEIKSELRD
jgi:hypothetical protein